MFNDLYEWIANPPAPRAVFLSGARQIGKTTLFLQVIEKLLRDGTPSGNILYATFDHPIFKLAGIDAVLEAWRERAPGAEGPEYLFLDEAQFIGDWGVWVKHQVDFFKQRRIALTGSAIPLGEEGRESGVGRWHTIRLNTLSFFEYLRIKDLKMPELPPLKSLRGISGWSGAGLRETTEKATGYVAHFHEYLLRGGFPQNALIDSISRGQKLLREDIIDKVLKRDMTAVFGVRKVLDLEKIFLYLCMHDGGLLSVIDLCNNLEIKRPTVERYVDYLEKAHLVFKLLPFGYGKDILRGRFKVYLADPAIAPAVMLKGESPLDDPTALGIAAEAAVVKHLFTNYRTQNARFTYWKGSEEREVDLVAEVGGKVIPFEVKYRAQHTGSRDVKGFLALCGEKKAERGYLITKSLNDFGPASFPGVSTAILRIPAPLLCYWIGQMELSGGETD